MGQRTKNRILEHSRVGHRLEKSNVTHLGVPVVENPFGKSFWLCKCGWEGWLVNNLDGPE